MVQNLMLQVVQSPNVVSGDLGLHHVDGVRNLLGLFLFRVELHRARCRDEVIDDGGEFRLLEVFESRLGVSEPLPERSLLCLPDLSKYLLDVAWGQRASTADCDLSLQKIE